MIRPLISTLAGVLALASVANAQYRGLAYTIDSDTTNHLWAIDLASGQVADIGATGTGPIEALTFHPDGRLFGINDEDDTLYSIDLKTGAAELVGPLGVEVSNPGFAIDSAGIGWIVTDAVKNLPSSLHSVDLLTGTATVVGEQGFELEGLTAIGSTLYAINAQNPGLFRIDKKRGAAELVAEITGPFNGNCPSIEATPDGRLIAMDDSGEIFELDPITGVATPLSTTISGVESLAIPLHQVCAYTVDADNSDRLWMLELLTGQSIPIGSTGFDELEGLSFAPDGRLFAVNDDGTPELVEINLHNGNGSSVGDLGVTINNPGFAIDPSGVGFIISDDATGSLHSVNLGTGAGTLVGSTNLNGYGLSFRGENLFAIQHSPNELYQIDPSTANATLVGAFSNVISSCGGLSFGPDGTCWSLDDLGQILTISATTGAAIRSASTLNGCEALAIPPGCGANRFNMQVTSLDFEAELPVLPASGPGGELGELSFSANLPVAELPENTAALAIEVFINGDAVSDVIALDEKGKAASENGVLPSFKVSFNRKKGALKVDLGNNQIRPALGLSFDAGSGAKLIAVQVLMYAEIDGGSPVGNFQCWIPFNWTADEVDGLDGEYSGKKDGPNYSGVAIASKVSAKQTIKDAFDIKIKGVELPNGGGALIPQFPVLIDGKSSPVAIIRIGDAEPLEIPFGSLLVKGEGTKAKWSLDKAAKPIPGLKKISYSASNGSLSLDLEDLAGTGIPPVELDGELLSHELAIEVSVLTNGGWQTFTQDYVLTRKSATTSTWN